MSKRLLPESQALRKIELSLKLQGMSFKPESLKCSKCKFCWENIEGKRPRWSPKYYDYATNTYVVNPIPQPEKWRWYCFKYKASPSHAFLRFNVIRRNAEGAEVFYRGRWAMTPTGNQYTTDPMDGEKDELVFVPKGGKRWRWRVCRRFEAAPRK